MFATTESIGVLFVMPSLSDRRSSVIRAVVVSCSALALGACGGKSGGVPATGTLILQASGGPSGEVAADVALIEPGVGQERTCSAPVEAGACQLTSCQLGGIGSPAPGYGNFGPIAASIGTTTVPLVYGGFGYPTVGFPAPIALGTGGTMRFRGGGGNGVPAFDVSASIPGLAVITSPIPTTNGATSIDTSQDLSVTWLPIPIGQIQFLFEEGFLPANSVSVSVVCKFDGTTGHGVVSKTLLSSLKEMSGANPTFARLTSGLEATTVVDGLTIVTQSSQNSPTTGRDFSVILE